MLGSGYIPHNGIATIDQFVDGTFTGTLFAYHFTFILTILSVFGMGRDLALILAIYGTVFDGDISSLTFSIGEGDNSILRSLFPQNGLTDSHNNYEADASPMKGDLYQ